MKKDTVTLFKKERKRLNEIVMKYSTEKIKKFYSLDAYVYKEGTLSKKTKELLGLVASLVLRCDDCITYHLIQCYEDGITNEELEEAFAIGLVVGGSITIPHLRRAFKTWDELKK
ncbi:alkylhydroperoxidase [candidate division TA06 bacterium DG_78]|uniref:Alkylhydroperoxidase n=1 Tax=candidate division TA06 bacterium DG_78 TaxID=1703772 RepID=A0A0S7YCA6_UNCT6|nr:MAG: alkylhydroperoxidase [candidate division TA06 bacterium DG_78]